MLRSLLILISLLAAHTAAAQWQPCIDSGRVNPMFQCNQPFYNPVCGCNGITYRNECTAYNQHGVTQWRSGVCSGLDMDILPNPAGPNSMLTINLSFPELVYANADLKIVDLYGKVWEQRILNQFNRYQLQLDLSTLKTGIYIVVVSSSLNSVSIRKLVKY